MRQPRLFNQAGRLVSQSGADQQSSLYVRFTFCYDVVNVPQFWSGLGAEYATLPKLFDVCPDGVQLNNYINRQNDNSNHESSAFRLDEVRRRLYNEATQDERRMVRDLRIQWLQYMQKAWDDVKNAPFDPTRPMDMKHLSTLRPDRPLISDLYLRFDNVSKPVLLLALKINELLPFDNAPIEGFSYNPCGVFYVFCPDNLSVENPLVMQFRRVVRAVNDAMLAGSMRVTDESSLATLFSASNNAALNSAVSASVAFAAL